MCTRIAYSWEGGEVFQLPLLSLQEQHFLPSLPLLFLPTGTGNGSSRVVRILGVGIKCFDVRTEKTGDTSNCENQAWVLAVAEI